ncbi:hypothetical protein [Salinibacter ruber]|uniref:hypothetical protein n=1 Tax=Salinibacter ruber TaxID=146919 RepID=UPI002072F0A5|nr:hypothetical protein [Salinibacter ruber]
MSSSQASWWPLTVAALTFITLVGCDVPTGNSSPSINTDTEISTPLVQEKTFTFLGGPNSEFDPLIDTTSSDFDSLFEVESSNNDISVVQEIDNFDIGNLNEALDNATGSLTFDQKTFDETFIDLQKEGFTFAGERQIGVLNVELQRSATANIPVRGSNRVAFKKSQNNYVELGPTTIEVQNITSSPTAPGGVFDSLRFTYPDIRVEPYGEDNQLVVDFVENPCGSGPCGSNGEYERDISGDGFRIDLEGARIYPDKPNIDENGTVTFKIGGQVNPDLTVKDDDKISFGASTSFKNFKIREIDVDQAKPFAVDITPNENGGDINVANDNEVRTAAFDGFGGITDRVDGLKLADVSLTFQVETGNLASTDAQVYAAIQGTNETNQIYLRGTEDQNMSRGADRNVSSLPFSAAFTENGVSLQNESLIKLGVGLEEAALGETVRTPLLVDGDNSNVADFVNTLPTEVRLAGQAELNTDGGGLQVRKPIALDANFSLNVPLRIRDRFVVRDTIDADLSDLNDLTDPEEDVNISTAELQFSYTNGLPLGADVKMVIVDAAGSVIEPRFNRDFDNDNFRIEPAAKDKDGAAAAPSSGTFVFTLGSTQEALRALAEGDKIRLAFNMDQAGSGGGSEAAARLRADDQLTLNRVRLEADASIQTGN